jgi:hypothetical protein
MLFISVSKVNHYISYQAFSHLLFSCFIQIFATISLICSGNSNITETGSTFTTWPKKVTIYLHKSSFTWPFFADYCHHSHLDFDLVNFIICRVQNARKLGLG